MQLISLSGLVSLELPPGPMMYVLELVRVGMKMKIKPMEEMKEENKKKTSRLT